MIKGSCLCGKVQYEIHGEMGFITHFHCPSCQKAHATAFSSVAAVQAGEFSFTSGESLLKYYESSPGKKRWFCSNCGSQIYAKRDDQEHYIWRMGTIDGDPGTRPTQHIFTRYKADWYHIHDDIPEYDEWADSAASDNENGDFHCALQMMLEQAVCHATPASLLWLESQAGGQEISGILDQEIRRNIRKSDSFEMLDAHICAILLPYTDATASMILAERILNAMKSHTADVTFSIGAATATLDLLRQSENSDHIHTLISMAQTANANARQTGNHAASHYDSLS